MVTFAEYEFEVIGHALGINVYYSIRSNDKKSKTLPVDFYRNYYCYGNEKSGDKRPEWMVNIADYIEEWKQNESLYFKINELGIELFRKQFKEEITDKFVPLSRSKQRYQSFLRADTGQTFAEFLNIKR